MHMVERKYKTFDAHLSSVWDSALERNPLAGIHCLYSMKQRRRSAFGYFPIFRTVSFDKITILD